MEVGQRLQTPRNELHTDQGIWQEAHPAATKSPTAVMERDLCATIRRTLTSQMDKSRRKGSLRGQTLWLSRTIEGISLVHKSSGWIVHCGKCADTGSRGQE